MRTTSGRMMSIVCFYLHPDNFLKRAEGLRGHNRRSPGGFRGWSVCVQASEHRATPALSKLTRRSHSRSCNCFRAPHELASSALGNCRIEFELRTSGSRLQSPMEGDAPIVSASFSSSACSWVSHLQGGCHRMIHPLLESLMVDEVNA